MVDQISKLFEGILVINWKDGKMRMAKRKTKVTPMEIPIRIKLKINVPGEQDIVASGEITISKVKAKEMVISQI